MIKSLVTVCSLCAVLSVSAAEKVFTPVIRMRGAVEVYVQQYSMVQFPNRTGTDRQFILAVAKSTYDGWSAAGKALLRTGLRKMRSGETQVTRAKVQAWRDQLAAAGIDTEVVLPAGAPTIGAKLYLIVVGAGQEGNDRLTELGVVPRPMDEGE